MKARFFVDSWIEKLSAPDPGRCFAWSRAPTSACSCWNAFSSHSLVYKGMSKVSIVFTLSGTSSEFLQESVETLPSIISRSDFPVRVFFIQPSALNIKKSTRRSLSVPLARVNPFDRKLTKASPNSCLCIAAIARVIFWLERFYDSRYRIANSSLRRDRGVRHRL